ncbi:PREDICTED: WAS protein family homolog DDB_G0292878-like [Camelina sativa]|uniref:WAS protein family homolog DDB_G0292878-like n=1 Tax=Camelina sativa TaxID=90675 RepID=A0ABM0Z0Q6_CAMSA|nr:PREDICTED: WAS protein family homolog DDB_G0292878-like [Camelina sativa]
MGKILVEICLISARGLRVGIGIGSSLLKHQWYAVGWLDPEDKYCTTIDASRSDNPVWRTKFATLLDDSAVQDSKSVLHVEVYSREPLFLRKRLHGSATVSLKEFLTKYKQQESSSKAVVEETGSYQLRKQNSSKPQGFVDISIRISAEQEDFGVFTGDFGGVMLSNNSDYNTSGQDYMAGPSQHPFASMNQSNNSNPFSSVPNPPMNHTNPQMQQPYYPPPMQHSSVPNPPMNHTSPQMQQPYYPPPMQPPPPMNSGYMPTNIPKSENVTNIPSSSGGAPGGAGRGYARPGLGFAAGLGAGAVVGAAAGLYGGEFMSGFDLPSTLPHPSVSISIDPPF